MAVNRVDAVDKVIEQIAPTMDGIVHKYMVDGQGRSCWDAALALLCNHHELYWEQQCPPNQVGCSMGNRGGLGLQIQKAFSNAVNHTSDGYSRPKAEEGAFAISSPPPPENDEAVKFNNRLSDTQPALPPLAMLVLESIGSGHGNAFLRAVLAGSPCTYKQIAPSGFLDKEFLSKNHQGLAEALKGLKWKVIHYKVVRRWPQIAEVGQSVLNRKHQMEISEIEGMLTIHNRANAFTMEGKPIDWSACEHEAVSSNPAWKDWSSALIKLCKVMDRAAVQEVCLKHGALIEAAASSSDGCSLHGMLGAAYIEKVAAAKWKTLKQYPRMRAAYILGNLDSPALKIVTGKCMLISAAHVNKITTDKLLPLLKQCEGFLDEANEWLRTCKVSDAVFYKSLAVLDCNMVYHFCGIGSDSRVGIEYESPLQIMQVSRSNYNSKLMV